MEPAVQPCTPGTIVDLRRPVANPRPLPVNALPSMLVVTSSKRLRIDLTGDLEMFFLEVSSWNPGRVASGCDEAERFGNATSSLVAGPLLHRSAMARQSRGYETRPIGMAT